MRLLDKIECDFEGSKQRFSKLSKIVIERIATKRGIDQNQKTYLKSVLTKLQNQVCQIFSEQQEKIVKAKSLDVFAKRYFLMKSLSTYFCNGLPSMKAQVSEDIPFLISYFDLGKPNLNHEEFHLHQALCSMMDYFNRQPFLDLKNNLRDLCNELVWDRL